MLFSIAAIVNRSPRLQGLQRALLSTGIPHYRLIPDATIHDTNAQHNTPIPFEEEVSKLKDFIARSSYLMAITGAGVSTDSGIPDYRGPNGSYRKGHKPITHSDFMQQEQKRKRYWARSMIGWQRVSQADPNPAHIALAELENMGKLRFMVTQNVDRLHERAGSVQVSDLHGRIDQVRCMACEQRVSRRSVQDQLLTLNQPFYNIVQERIQEEEKLRADGDVDLELEDYSKFDLPCCSNCGGLLKPDVVFFGDNVPLSQVQMIYEEVEKCDAVLVVGTSLEVFSAYRFIDRANKRGVPIAIINDGETRAERQRLPMVRFKSNRNCSQLLQEVLSQLKEGK